MLQRNDLPLVRLASALLTPAAAILPWVELGLGQDSPCRALLDAATKKEELRKPKAE
jgi:AsmA family protein